MNRLSKDILEAKMSATEARFLVDAYYQMQDNRIRAEGQVRSIGEEPHEAISWLAEHSRFLEDQVKKALDKYSNADPDGIWMRNIIGIGPVLAAGFLAHIDITKAPTVGHIWSFAGLNPTAKWGKGQKRPWNAQLKVLCWKAGESFVKVQNNDKDIYGTLYAERKLKELAINETGGFSKQAAAALANKNYSKDTDAYKAYITGKLPPAHIHARAKRYAVKLFLAHMHEQMYREHYKMDPPLPYPIAHMGHVHKI